MDWRKQGGVEGRSVRFSGGKGGETAVVLFVGREDMDYVRKGREIGRTLWRRRVSTLVLIMVVV